MIGKDLVKLFEDIGDFFEVLKKVSAILVSVFFGVAILAYVSVAIEALVK